MATRRRVTPGWVRVPQPFLSPSQAWEEGAIGEVNVILDGSTWKMFYGGGWDNGALGYATCTGDPTVGANWTKYASNPTLGQGGSSIAGYAARSTVLKLGANSYRCFYADANPNANIKVSDSTDGIAWGTPTTAIASNAVSGVTGWANSTVWTEDGGTNWKMLVDCRTTAPNWGVFYATSTDGHAFTPQGTEITSLKPAGTVEYGSCHLPANGPVNGIYHLWYHAGVGVNSAICHARATDPAGPWTISPGRELQPNLGTYERDQAADAFLVENAGRSYMFYSGTNNAGEASYINVAVYQGTLAQRAMWL